MKKYLITILTLMKIVLGNSYAGDTKEASTVVELTPLLALHQPQESFGQAPLTLDSRSKCSKCFTYIDWSKASKTEKALVIYKLLTALSTTIPFFLAPTSNYSPGHSLAYTIYNSAELLNLFLYSLVISEFPETTFMAKSCATIATMLLTSISIFSWMHWYARVPHFSTLGDQLIPWVFILMSVKFSQP